MAYEAASLLKPLNAELKPIRHLLALVGVHHFVHVSSVRVNGTEYSPSRDNFIKRVNKVFFSVYVDSYSSDENATVRYGVRMGQAVRFRYTQIKHKILQKRNSRCFGQRYIARSME